MVVSLVSESSVNGDNLNIKLVVECDFSFGSGKKLIPETGNELTYSTTTGLLPLQ